MKDIFIWRESKIDCLQLGNYCTLWKCDDGNVNDGRSFYAWGLISFMWRTEEFFLFINVDLWGARRRFDSDFTQKSLSIFIEVQQDFIVVKMDVQNPIIS